MIQRAYLAPRRGIGNILTVVAVCVAAAFAYVPAAQAFEVFGVRLWGDAKEPDETITGDRVAYSTELTVSGDEDLKDVLLDASALVSRQDDPPPSVAALVSRARADRKRLIAELYANGRYGATVDLSVGGVDIDQPATGGSGNSGDAPVPVVIQVDPGPEFTFGDLSVDIDGSAVGAADLAEFGLVPGDVARSTLIVDASGKMVRAWRDKGHALARVSDREIVADHATKTVDVRYSVEPGPLASFGETSVDGTDRMDPAFIRRYAAIEEGRRYDPKELKKAEKRLRDLGVFDSVKIRQGTELNADGTLPLTIEVSERKRRFIGVGATYSNTEGAAIEVYWGHRNLFGGAERIRVEGSVGRIGDSEIEDFDYSAKVAFAKPGVFGPATEFTADVFAIRENPDAYTRTAAGGLVGITYRFDEYLTGKAGVELERSRVDDTFGENDYLLAGTPVALTYDSRNNKLDPSSGFLATLAVEPLHDFYDNKNMALFEGSFSAYQSIDDANRFILAGKVAAGSAVGAGLRDIPADRRFHLGGGGTIRGYAYQNVGPRRMNGDVFGGLSYFLVSGEVRTRVTDTLGVVAFVDSGNAYRDRSPDFSEPMRTGVGAGIRYLTPIGPLRLDAAVPLDGQKDDPDFAIYVGIGQAF